VEKFCTSSISHSFIVNLWILGIFNDASPIKGEEHFCVFFMYITNIMQWWDDIVYFFVYLTTLCHMRVSLEVEWKVVWKITEE